MYTVARETIVIN